MKAKLSLMMDEKLIRCVKLQAKLERRSTSDIVKECLKDKGRE